MNAIALACSAVFIIKFRKNLGCAFSLFWIAILVPGAIISGQEYRFILFAMLPGAYLVGDLLAKTPALLRRVRRRSFTEFTKVVIALILVLLTVSGTFPSIAVASFNPSGRNYQSAIYDSMIWLERSSCASGVASVGLWPDYEYLPALTGIPYAGDFIRPPSIVLQKSLSLGFHCLVVARNNQYFTDFENDPGLVERYHNQLVVILAIDQNSFAIDGCQLHVMWSIREGAPKSQISLQRSCEQV
jgi:hypothetical protein